MQTSTRYLSALAGAAVAIATVGAASAETVVNTTSPSVFGIFETANLDNENMATNLAQQFSLSSTYNLDSLSFFGSGTNIDMYIIDAVAPDGDDPDSVLWEAHGIEAPGSRSWRDVPIGGLTLGPGDYYVVMASDDAAGGRWSLVTTLDPSTLAIGADGVGMYEKGSPEQRVAGVNYTFTPEDNLSYALRVEGTEIPTPGALTIAGIGGLICLKRRRR